MTSGVSNPTNIPKGIDTSALEDLQKVFSNDVGELSKVFPGKMNGVPVEVSVETQQQANRALLTMVEKEILSSVSPNARSENFSANVHQRLESLGLQPQPITGADVARVIGEIVSDFRTEDNVVNGLFEHLLSGALAVNEANEAVRALLQRGEISQNTAVNVMNRLGEWLDKNQAMVQSGKIKMLDENSAKVDREFQAQLLAQEKEIQAKQNYDSVKSNLVQMKNEGAPKAEVLFILQSAVQGKTISSEQAAQLEKELYPVQGSVNSEKVKTVLNQLQQAGLSNKSDVENALAAMVQNKEISQAEAKQILQNLQGGTETTSGSQSLTSVEQNAITLLKQQQITQESEVKNALTSMVQWGDISQKSADRILQHLFPGKAAGAQGQPLSEFDRRRQAEVIALGQQYANLINGDYKHEFSDDEIRGRVIEKLTQLDHGKPNTFATELYNEKPHLRLDKLRQEYADLIEIRYLQNQFQQMQKHAQGKLSGMIRTLFPDVVDEQTLRKITSRVQNRLDEYSPFVYFLREDQEKPNPLQGTALYDGYITETIKTLAPNVIALNSSKPVNPATEEVVVANDDPNVGNVQPGIIFGQHTNTCFMMSIINALTVSKEGAEYVRQWMIDHANSPLQQENGFSLIEQQMAHLYSQWDDWFHLGKMGMGVDMLDVLGLSETHSLELKLLCKGDVNSDELRYVWVEAGQRFGKGEGAIFYTDAPKHYRAVVGTWGDPNGNPTKDFGFILHDSLGKNRQFVPMSQMIVGQSQPEIIFFERPAQVQNAAP